MSAGFVHLHVHSEYSVLDGAAKVSELLERCKDYGMRACALTDHGSLFGAVDFYQSAKKMDIKPILGSELYVAKGSRLDRSSRAHGGNYHHLLMLCENETGYHNLCRLSSLGYTEGFYYRPRVDDELLARYHEGLIVSSACLMGEIPQQVLAGNLDAANASIRKYVGMFGKDNFLIEIMDHGMPDQEKVNPILAELAEHHGLMLIASNDCHYLDRTDAEAHDTLLSIQTSAHVEDEKRFRFEGDTFHFSSPDEMKAKFARWPEAVSNTEKVAARCNVELKLHQHLIPQYAPPEGFTKAAFLRHLVQLGLEDRYDGRPSPEHLKRADYELSVIESMNLVDYFLVVWDLIAHARNKGIPVGPGRGSGAGSLVAYALRITNIDPIRYHLLFERMLNPERKEMPDFDLDFCYTRRGEVIEYVREKYGKDNVSQIITFGRMLAKAVVRDVGRALGMPYADVDRIAKLIPDELKITLQDAMEKEPQLQYLVKQDPQVERLWKLARRLEGTIRSCGTHAAGVVISDRPLTDYVPLFQASGSDVVATQFDMNAVNQVGLLKMDFLGLRTLTVVHEAVRFIRQNRAINIDIDSLEPDDPAAYALLRSGQTTGVFQLESSGMRDLAKRIGLDSLEEICALIALYRPGPMALKDQYIENKYHAGEVKYDHPLLEPILRETYGIALYQEQVMQIVQAIAGFSLGQADILRRAMGKKKHELMAEQRERFVQGAKANGIDAKTATELFDKIEQFAGYGFNKSHSMAYAYVAYQTAFLKANYPVEFMAALLTSESGNLDKVALYVDECRRMGIEVLPPDVNSSCLGFAVEKDRIRFGLGTVKNVGEGAVQAIVLERDEGGPYKDLFDFCKRIDSRQINRRVVESLNRAGAFVSTGWNRRQVDAVIDAAINEGQVTQREREAGQTSLLDLMGGDDSPDTSMHQKPNLAEWNESELLALERDMLGLYVTSHPLAKHAKVLERFTSINVPDIPELPDGHEGVLGGSIVSVKNFTTARGKKMAFVTVGTLTGTCEVTVFSDLFETHAGLLVPDMIVMVTGRVNIRDGKPSIVANDIIPIDDAERRLTRSVHIRLNTVGVDKLLLEQLARVLSTAPGKCDVFLHCLTPEHNEVTVRATAACRVAPSFELREQVETLLGSDSLWYTGSNGSSSHDEVN